ncbi:MAG: SAM hydrolase/SAM-dependent halogenase family protein [Bacteroidota bacterium]
MAIITLTTDLGLKDYYVSAIKGAIISRLPDVTLLDVSHQIPTYNIQDAAFVLKNSYPVFPEGSIHIIGVKAEYSPQSPHVIVFANGHYFIAADNGIFSLLLDKNPEKIIELDTNASTFPTRDIFAVIACRIAKGELIEQMGKPKTALLERMPFRATSMADMIRGTVVYIDSYGNVMTNISRGLFNEIGKNREFIIEFARYEISKMSKAYNDVPEGEILALFNATGHLEIAMNNDKANSMLNLKLNDTITIRFQ